MRILQKSLINDKKTKRNNIRNINKRLWLESRTSATTKSGYDTQPGYILFSVTFGLKVIVEAETSVVGGHGLGLFLLGAAHDTGLLVVTNTLLEEVGLTGQGDVLHKVKGVGGVEVLLVTQGHQKTVGNELNVLAHQVSVHTQQSNGKSICQEFLLNGHGLDNDVFHDLLIRTDVQVREQQTGEVRVEALITRDELVGESQTRHQTTLLQPEDRSKRSREEDALDCGKGHKTGSEGGFLVLDPLDGPVGLPGNAGNFNKVSTMSNDCREVY